MGPSDLTLTKQYTIHFQHSDYQKLLFTFKVFCCLKAKHFRTNLVRTPPRTKFASSDGGEGKNYFRFTSVVLGCLKRGRTHLPFPPWGGGGGGEYRYFLEWSNILLETIDIEGIECKFAH